MEEFWKPLADPIFADFNQDKLKTGRKESALGVFVTQSPSDVLQHPISKTVVEQSATLLFLPNPRAHYADYVDGFKVTPQEFEVIRTLPEAGRMFLVKQGTRSAIVKLDLAGFTDELVVLSGSVDNVKLLDAIRAQVGDKPEAWMPILMKQVAQRRVLAKNAREAA
jgi:type IV secretion system protein VirB4